VVALMVLFYAFEDRSTWFILAFAVSCILASSMGFYRGRGRSGRLRSCGLSSPSASGGSKGIGKKRFGLK